MNILVTDGGYRNTLAIVRHLGKLKANVYVIADMRPAMSYYSRYCRKGMIGPSPFAEEAYFRFIRDVVRHERFNLLIPVGLQSTKVISEHKAELEQFVNMVIADYTSFEIAANKRKTYQLAERVGVPYPRTLYPANLDEVAKLSDEFCYPVVIKSVFGSGMVSYAGNNEEVIGKYDLMCKRYSLSKHMPMLQEYVQGDIVWSFGGLYERGNCKKVFMYKEIRSFPVRGGSAAYVESFYDKKLKCLSMTLLDNLKWHGVAHVEFKLAKAEKELKLMEINPKFWASLDIALAAGVNFPYYLCEMACGKELGYSEEYDRNLKFHFPLSGEFMHLKEKPSSIINVIADTLNLNVKSNVWLSDIKPNIIELMITMTKILLSIMPEKLRWWFEHRWAADAERCYKQHEIGQ